ncbi:hypothetical protein KEM55_006072 [Ascosphaera atra]|nr:hypothetical protein KEM55_006072 [Ascosphaera atra]
MENNARGPSAYEPWRKDPIRLHSAPSHAAKPNEVESPGRGFASPQRNGRVSPVETSDKNVGRQPEPENAADHSNIATTTTTNISAITAPISRPSAVAGGPAIANIITSTVPSDVSKANESYSRHSAQSSPNQSERPAVSNQRQPRKLSLPPAMEMEQRHAPVITSPAPLSEPSPRQQQQDPRGVLRKRMHDSDSDAEEGHAVRKRYTATQETNGGVRDAVQEERDEHHAMSRRQQLIAEESVGNSRSLSYPVPEYPPANSNEYVSVADANVRRGMSLPTVAPHPQRTDTVNSTTSVCELNMASVDPAYAAQHSSSNGKKHRCSHCGTEFTRHHNLKSHLLTHSEEKPHVCNVCNQRFRRRHDMKRHMKLHTGERPHICPRCGRRFARGDALARHAKGPGGCAGRRESGGSSLGLGEPGEYLSTIIENGGSASSRPDLPRSPSISSATNLSQRKGNEKVTVTVSSARHDGELCGAEAKGDAEGTIFTEPDLMDEEDERNTPLRLQRGRVSGEDKELRPYAAVRKHQTVPDSHHLHPSSAYNRRQPPLSNTYPTSRPSSTTSAGVGLRLSPAPVGAAQLLPSPVSRANSNAGTDGGDRPSKDVSPSAPLQSANVSDSPESAPPAFTQQEHSLHHRDDSDRPTAHGLRPLSPRLTRERTSPMMHKNDLPRLVSPPPTSSSPRSRARLQADMTQAPVSSMPLEHSESSDFRNRHSSLKPHYHAILTSFSQHHPQHQQQLSPRELPPPPGMTIGRPYLSQPHPSDSHNQPHSHQYQSYAHQSQAHRHSASTSGGLAAGYSRHGVEETLPAITSPPHRAATYSHAHAHSASRHDSHSNSLTIPRPHMQSSTATSSAAPLPSPSLQRFPPSTSSAMLTPIVSSTSAPNTLSTSAATHAPTSTAAPPPHLPPQLTLPQINPPTSPSSASDSSPYTYPPTRPQRTLSATSATSVATIPTPISGTAPTKIQLPPPSPDVWGYVRTLEDRIVGLEDEVRRLRSVVHSRDKSESGGTRPGSVTLPAPSSTGIPVVSLPPPANSRPENLN